MNARRMLALLCVVLFGAAAYSQQTITTATVSGHVEDATGAVLRVAAVEITNPDTNQKWSALTDDEGAFRVMYIPAGRYLIRVDAAGFMPARRSFELTLGQALEIPLRLALSTDNQTVEVRADIPTLELVRTQVAETVTPAEVNRLPLNGRNYLDLALLVPSVSRTNTGASQRFAESSAVPGTGISVAGQRNLNNSFVVDGLSANDDAADLAGTFFSQEVIREFAVVSAGGVAEFGRASSGVINIVTRSGTNTLHGGAYGFLRNQRLDATNALATHKDPLTQVQYGVSLGGPLVKDRTFLFANFEQLRQHAAGIITIAPANVAAINTRLDISDYSGPQIRTGEYPTTLNTSNFFLRLDHQVSSGNQLSARYSLYDVTSTNARNVGGLNAVSRAANLGNRDQAITISDLAALGPNLLNEMRFQFARGNLAAPVNDVAGPAVNISGVASFGTATFSPTARTADVYQLVDNLSAQRGHHSFKTGADFLYDRVNIAFPGALQGVYTFSSMANFLSGKYVTFQQAFGAAEQFQSNPNLGAFVQDEWRVRRDLTVNMGLRYDAQFLPAPVHPDVNNIAPRLGIAFAPGGSTRTVVRASYGLYYDRIPLRAMSNALQRDGLKYKVAVVPFGQPAAPVFPNVLPDFPANLLTSITSINPHIESTYAQQAALQVEHELTPGMSLAAGYLHLRGEHLMMSHNLNVPTSATAPNLGRPDPRFANNSQFDSLGDSYYDGLTVSLNKRASHWGSFRVSYNLSKAIDTAGNFFFSTPQDNSNIAAERARSDNDQRHRVAFSGTLEMPQAAERWRRALAGFRLGYVLSYTSALPFNLQTGTDRNGDTNVNDRPAGVGRNTGRGFDFTSLDLRLSRRLKLGERLSLETMVEGFNILNHRNDQLPNNVFGPGLTPRAGFGLPTAVGDPRQMQLALRLNF